VDKWIELKGQSRPGKSAAMWETFGMRTVSCMARGTRYLAAMWQAAWTQSGADQLTKANVAKAELKVDENVIKALYNAANVVRSVSLSKYPDDPGVDWSSL
jgi:hypothetical protein